MEHVQSYIDYLSVRLDLSMEDSAAVFAIFNRAYADLIEKHYSVLTLVCAAVFIYVKRRGYPIYFDDIRRVSLIPTNDFIDAAADMERNVFLQDVV